MSITIQNVTYRHANNETLFQDINLSINKGDKVALTGNNGSGKSTLLRIVSGKLKASAGTVICENTSYFIPQHFGQYDQMSIAEAIGIKQQWDALGAIIKGDVSPDNFTILNDNWEIEDKALSALAYWGLDTFSLNQKMESLSGGEKTKVFLSGIIIHSPHIILMDEPTNHLDSKSRQKLYDFISKSKATIFIVSHDRILLNQISYIYELNKNGITAYGGNYKFYKNEKDKTLNSLQEKLISQEKELRMARKEARTIAERKQKQDIRGEKANLKKRISRMAMNTLQDKAEKSSSKLKEVHAEKQEDIRQNISRLRDKLPDIAQMKINFSSSELHIGRILITAEKVNFTYEKEMLWNEPLTFQIKSGDRIAIEGENGAGKTTLLHLITGKITPSTGKLQRAKQNFVYIDQEYSIIDNNLNIYEQAQHFNVRHLPEHEIKMILNRFLFPLTTWNKHCKSLSGGEKMRLALCCLMINNNTPDIFILDEPTNNIDIQNIEIITATIKDYQGTVLVISHDEYFQKEIGIQERIKLVKK